MKKIILFAAALLLLVLPALCEEEDSEVTYAQIYQVPSVTQIPYTPTPVPVVTPVPTEEPRYEADGSITLTITCVGDVTIGRNVQYKGTSIFDKELSRQSGDPNFIFRNTADIFRGDDLSIVNFEGVLADSYTIPSAKKKNEFLFLAPPAYAQTLTNAGIEIATIENNHIDDFGTQGRADTQNALTAAGILWADEYHMAVYELQGLKVGVLAYKTFDYYDTLNVKVPQQVAAARETCDLVIVAFHWGAEKDYYPNNNQQRLAHKTIDAGADLVIGHHSHRINPIELYKGKYIVYSLGNFSFAGHNKPDDMSTFLFQTRFRIKNGQIVANPFRIIPARISSRTDYNDFTPTPYTDDLHISNVIRTMTSNGRRISSPVSSYPLDWE